MTRLAACLCLTFALLPASLPAQTLTVGDLLEQCQKFEEGDRSGGAVMTYGYCLGVLQGASMVMEFNCENAKAGVTLPPILTMEGSPKPNDALHAAFVSWAQANPDQASKNYYFGVTQALSSAYPCQPKS